MSWIVFLAVLLLLVVIRRPAAAAIPTIAPFDRVARLADAIAQAEGYYRSDRETIPQRLNNPGDLKDPETWQLIQFPTPEAGWAALYRQVDLMLSGQSHVYNPDMSLIEVAELYTGYDNAQGWARTVAQCIGLQPSNTLRQYAEG